MGEGQDGARRAISGVVRFVLGPWPFFPWVMFTIGFIFWFLILRPQMRRQKEHQTKIGGIKKGDQVITGGGLIGKVIKVDETFVELELGTNVRVKAIKATIGDIIPPGGKPAND